jgi:hypothetical protein
VKKNRFLHIICLLLFAGCFNTCKKYEEGGLVYRSKKNLFGGNNVGDSKTWKLKLYEVNNIDSTYLIQGSGVPDFYERHITFSLSDKRYSDFYAESYIYKFNGTIEQSEKSLYIGLSRSEFGEDSLQCRLINGTNYCARDIFNPEIKNFSSQWKVNRLTSKELIITKQMSNSYRIILEH